MNVDIVARRLRSQYLGRAAPWREVAEVAAWFGAVQAQEYGPARWGLAQRMVAGTRDAAIARACDEGRLLRTHVLRPTWHFVAPADLGWMLKLTGPRILRGMPGRHRALELDPPTLVRAASCFERALGGGQSLTRAELGQRLAAAGIAAASGPRLAHLSMYAELEGILCSGPWRGKHATYALLAERAPASGPFRRDEAVAELVRRYFQSHGPATLRDFAWWSGLTMADGKLGLEMHRAPSAVVGGLTYWWIDAPAGRSKRTPAHLLPIYDEYLVAYRDRVVVPHGPSKLGSPAGESVTFQHAAVVAGHVAGTWRVTRRRDRVVVTVTPLRRLSGEERAGLAEAAHRYGAFLGQTVETSVPK